MSIDPAAELRHELRTPLNHIIGYAELLLEDHAEGPAAALAPGLQALIADGRDLLARLNEVLAQRTGKVPLLLLDDVSSELDQNRNRRFFKLLSLLGSQVFLTTTHREFILLEEERCDFRLEAGAIERV